MVFPEFLQELDLWCRPGAAHSHERISSLNLAKSGMAGSGEVLGRLIARDGERSRRTSTQTNTRRVTRVRPAWWAHASSCKPLASYRARRAPPARVFHLRGAHTWSPRACCPPSSGRRRAHALKRCRKPPSSAALLSYLTSPAARNAGVGAESAKLCNLVMPLPTLAVGQIRAKSI